ncbi:hypothetical protein Nepgr_005302 [Nepenthes gracilis]|uniref:Uncharacterized protein n=1 Tax=Nepenthes gracilis TaxID=150966 RepID=A0AAD3XGA0_NEPGR|nr:hypothetical protein Nepgr_005302 [Nepenthes gracilis]
MDQCCSVLHAAKVVQHHFSIATADRMQAVSAEDTFQKPNPGRQHQQWIHPTQQSKNQHSKISTSNLTTISSKSSVPGQQHCGPIRICYSRAEKAERMQQPHPSITTMYHQKTATATIHTAPGHTIVAASADTDQPRYHNAQISMVDNHIAA